jgi:transposase
MKRFIKGESRTQTTLFPESLDDYVTEDNPVRVVDAFIDELDLKGLGFHRVDPKNTGRPGYHPSTLLKLYVYGYLNRVQSSRRLEQESHRNVELMWLIERLQPDFKTIADFRKDNGKAIRQVCKEFVLVCRHIGLLNHDVVAIDGSKFKAVNTRDKSFTKNKIKLRIKEVEESIDCYLRDLDAADKDDSGGSHAKVDRVQDKLKRLKLQMNGLKEIEAEIEQSPDKQKSLTDPDARIMKGSMNSRIAAYNVQSVVDPESHLMIAHEVTQEPSDRRQLFNMATQANEILQSDNLKVLADKGYYKSEEILLCHEAGFTTYLPKTYTSDNAAKGLFTRSQFIYIKEDNEYECPAGERLTWRSRIVEDGRDLDTYRSAACPQCKIRNQCTSSKQSRKIKRWMHEELLDALEDRMELEPRIMTLRKQTVEHPFGTIKHWMGATHFQMRRLENVKTEMSLHVLAYNMKRVINMIGVKALTEAIPG